MSKHLKTVIQDGFEIKKPVWKPRKLPEGHLIIHGITEEEATELMFFLLKANKFEADWWTQADIDTLDNAAMFAITTHNYPKPKTPKHYGENKK